MTFVLVLSVDALFLALTTKFTKCGLFIIKTGSTVHTFKIIIGHFTSFIPRRERDQDTSLPPPTEIWIFILIFYTCKFVIWNSSFIMDGHIFMVLLNYNKLNFIHQFISSIHSTSGKSDSALLM